MGNAAWRILKDLQRLAPAFPACSGIFWALIVTSISECIKFHESKLLVDSGITQRFPRAGTKHEDENLPQSPAFVTQCLSPNTAEYNPYL